MIRLIKWLKENNHLEDQELSNIEIEIKDEIQAAITFAEQGLWEEVADLTKDVYSPTEPVANSNHISQGEQL